MSERLWIAAGLGAVTGLRSMSGLALVSRELSDRRRLPGSARRLEAWLAEDMVAVALSALALGEMLADKLPGVPARVAPGPLFGRGLIGGLLGALAVGRDERALGAAVGVAAAVMAAYAGWFLRREAGRATFLPDMAVALAEDAMVVAAARELTNEL